MIGLQRLAIPSCTLAKCPSAKCPPFSLVTSSGECESHQSSMTLTLYTKLQTLFSTAPADLSAVIVVFIDILPNWALFGIIKQICHASVDVLMEWLLSGGWFSLRLHPWENHPPSGKQSIMIPTLAHAYLYSVECSFSYIFLWFQPGDSCATTGCLKYTFRFAL